MRLALRTRLAQPDTWALVVLAALPFAYFWRVTLGAQVFGDGDISSVFLPFRSEMARALAEGRLPLWSPYLGGGFPLLAEGQAAAVYPPDWILYRFLPLPQALSYTILLHLAWAAIGMYLLCRSMRIGVPGAFLGAFAFAASGFFFGHYQHLALLSAAAWMPWLVWLDIMLWREVRTGGANRAIWFALSVLAIGMQFLCGSPQIEYLNVLVFAAFGIFGDLILEIDGQRPWREAARLWLTGLPKVSVTTVVQIALGTALAAIQLVPTFELAGLSARTAGQATSFLAEYSLSPRALSVFLAPFATLGLPSTLNQEYYGYVGLVPLALCAAAVLLARTRRTRLIFAFALLSLSLALGTWNPLYQIFVYLPAINQFRVPARFLLPCLFAVTILAGIGLDESVKRIGQLRLLRRLPRPDLAVALVLIGLTALDLGLFSLPFLSTLDSTQPPADLAASTPSVDTLAADRSSYRIFTDVYNVTLRPNHPAIYGLQSAQNYDPLELQRTDEYLTQLSPAMFNLMNIRYLLQPNGPLMEGFEEPTASVVLDLFDHAVDFPPTRIVRIELTSYTAGAGNLADGSVAGALALASADGSQFEIPLRIGVETGDWAAAPTAKPPRSAEVIPFPGYLTSGGRAVEGHKYLAEIDLPSSVEIKEISARNLLPTGTLTIEAVRLIDDNGKSVSVAALAGKDDFSLVFKSPAVVILENHNALPRAFVVHRAEVVPEDQTIGKLREPSFDPAGQVFLSEGQALEAGPSSSDRVQITDYAPERVAISVETSQAGYLVLADTFYPGWSAQVDGIPAAIERADYIFRAVLVPAGKHQIVFQFQPASLEWGAGISALSLALVMAILVLARAKRL